MTGEFLDVRPEIQDALRSKKAVVALESTVISHGLPFPENLRTAAQMELEVRRSGAIPATIGLADGKIIVGLGPKEIERFAQERDVVKVSRRDFAPVLAQRKLGATTVAATMSVCAFAGIRFFATGGIGGVHRGAPNTFDISADLPEFARSPVAVVCAGPKAVLDIPLTLEVLETLGVPVVGFGSSQLPSFYSIDSGFTLDYFGSTAEEVAEIATTHWRLGMTGGILITNPPPVEVAMSRGDIETLLTEALQAASQEQVRGKAVTPFLLSWLTKASGGKTLAVNQALLLNNARVAGLIAGAYWR
jgi:pseudouridine-5'-phosphate glycosidase